MACTAPSQVRTHLKETPTSLTRHRPRDSKTNLLPKPALIRGARASQAPPAGVHHRKPYMETLVPFFLGGGGCVSLTRPRMVGLASSHSRYGPATVNRVPGEGGRWRGVFIPSIFSRLEQRQRARRRCPLCQDTSRHPSLTPGVPIHRDRGRWPLYSRHSPKRSSFRNVLPHASRSFGAVTTVDPTRTSRSRPPCPSGQSFPRGDRRISPVLDTAQACLWLPLWTAVRTRRHAGVTSDAVRRLPRGSSWEGRRKSFSGARKELRRRTVPRGMGVLGSGVGGLTPFRAGQPRNAHGVPGAESPPNIPFGVETRRPDLIEGHADSLSGGKHTPEAESSPNPGTGSGVGGGGKKPRCRVS